MHIMISYYLEIPFIALTTGIILHLFVGSFESFPSSSFYYGFHKHKVHTSSMY